LPRKIVFAPSAGVLKGCCHGAGAQRAGPARIGAFDAGSRYLIFGGGRIAPWRQAAPLNPGRRKTCPMRLLHPQASPCSRKVRALLRAVGVGAARG